MPAVRRRAVLLDRDGTIIDDVGFVREVERVALVPGASTGLRRLVDAGLPLVVVSNQSGIGRGIITAAEATAVHARLVELLAGEGITLAGAYYCPHAPDEGCACRKPAPGLLLEAAADLDLDLAGSVMVGDAPRDVEAGRRAGARTVLLGAGDGANADRAAPSWGDASEAILALLGRS